VNASVGVPRLAALAVLEDMDPTGMPTLREIAETWPATVSVARAALAFGLSRSHAYDAASRGEFPARVIKVGGRYRVVTASIIAALSAVDQERSAA